MLANRIRALNLKPNLQVLVRLLSFHRTGHQNGYHPQSDVIARTTQAELQSIAESLDPLTDPFSREVVGLTGRQPSSAARGEAAPDFSSLASQIEAYILRLDQASHYFEFLANTLALRSFNVGQLCWNNLLLVARTLRNEILSMAEGLDSCIEPSMRGVVGFVSRRED